MENKEVTISNLGKIVQQKRKFLKLTQEELATASGTGTRFIQDIEKGKPTCHIGKTFDVLNALNINLQLAE